MPESKEFVGLGKPNDAMVRSDEASASGIG